MTLAQRAYEALRTEILQGTRPAGSALRTQELATQFDVSISVVREALVRLSGQHLVTLAPNIGFRVVEVSAADLRDLVETRVDLEGIALRRSIERGDLAWEAEVLSCHHVLENTPMFREAHAGTTEEWTTAHDAFHDSLLTACGSLRLLGFVRSLRDSAELYRQIGGAHASRDRDVAHEHRELMRLATSHRAEEAVVALADHLRRTAEVFEAIAFAANGER
jgi:DNA-binding GntR family transcriptional regulator